jgi:hypothetical protein
MLAGLPEPARHGTQKTLSEVVVALEREVVVAPRMSPMDAAVVADTAITFAAEAVGPAALNETFAELGPDALDLDVRGALYSVIAPALGDRGAIHLIG